MTWELAVNLLSAGVAFLLGNLLHRGQDWIRQRRSMKHLTRIQEQRHPRFTHDWLVRYYLDKGRLDDLYLFEDNGHRNLVPFLTRPSWAITDIAEEELIQQDVPQFRSTVNVDQRVLRRRVNYLPGVRRDGAVWNDLLACAAGVGDGPKGPRIRLIMAEYFQFLSACGSLEDETYDAIRGRNRRTPLRDKFMPDLKTAELCPLGAHAFGMQAAFVFDDDGVFKILIQRRSNSVSIYGGALAVVPVFGCQSFDLTDESSVSVYHNFLREVYEELYGGVEVERPGPRVDPRWFYVEPSVARLIEAREAGEFEFKLLGFGFDALNGEIDISGLALVTKNHFACDELARMTANWEIQNIQVWDLFGARLTAALLTNEFSPGSVYTIARAREVVRARKEGQS
ncbi:MAG TPA: hypothetical protein VFX70_16080 [Mycobacteriales bacterium]|nr:hypothetical protein [Mycobacteriales bacterium]